jgi:hypothetical protein
MKARGFGRETHGSGDDIRAKAIGDTDQPILEVQLALLQSLDLQLIGTADLLQGEDGGIQVAMVLFQPHVFALKLVAFLI